jgi:hypothetical protein
MTSFLLTVALHQIPVNASLLHLRGDLVVWQAFNPSLNAHFFSILAGLLDATSSEYSAQCDIELTPRDNGCHRRIDVKVGPCQVESFGPVERVGDLRFPSFLDPTIPKEPLSNSLALWRSLALISKRVPSPKCRLRFDDGELALCYGRTGTGQRRAYIAPRSLRFRSWKSYATTLIVEKTGEQGNRGRIRCACDGFLP